MSLIFFTLTKIIYYSHEKQQRKQCNQLENPTIGVWIFLHGFFMDFAAAFENWSFYAI